METAKRECILVEAAKAFQRFGFQKASVDDIAKAAKVAKGTIYLAAPSKKELFYEVLLREIRASNAEMQKLIDPRRNADEILVDITFASLASMDSRPLVRDLLNGNHADLIPELKPRFDDLRRICMEPVAEILRLGIRQHRFRSELDVEELSSILIDLHIATMLFHGNKPDREATFARRAAASFDMILRGLLK